MVEGYQLKTLRLSENPLPFKRTSGDFLADSKDLFSLWASLGDDDLATIELGTVQLVDSCGCVGIGNHLHEAEALGAARHLVHDDCCRFYGTRLFEVRLQGLVGRTPGNAAYEKSL